MSHEVDQPAPLNPIVASPVRGPDASPVDPPPRLHVLVVEDSKIVRDRLVALINNLRLGIRVSVAEDGGSGLQLFKDRRPDVVLLDIALPELNGFDLLVQMKSELPSTVIIMLTSYAYPEFRANAERLGADFFFSKSLEFERITHVLSSLVRS